MPDYRLYCVDGAGKITAAHDLRATNDAEAVAEAHQLKLSTKCELWERGRLVAEVHAHPPSVKSS
jgi:hypothetical protein